MMVDAKNSGSKARVAVAGLGAIGESVVRALDRGIDGLVLTAELSRREKVEDALSAFMTRRFERCRFIVEGSEKIGRWEQDHSLPIDPNQVRQQVVMAAMAPL